MYKAILISVVFAIVGIPIAAARDPHPLRAFKRLALGLAVFDALYMLALKYVYLNLYFPKL